MQGSKAAIRYARAIVNLAKDQGQLDQVKQDMDLIISTIRENRELQAFLKSPVVKNSIKKNALGEIFVSSTTVTKELFDVLLQNNRLDILQWVALRYIDLYNEEKGIQIAQVTTAVPLSDMLEKQIQRKIKELTGNVAQIQNTVDPEIIGGFILRVGDIQYNGSVRSQLNNFKRELQNTTYISKL